MLNKLENYIDQEKILKDKILSLTAEYVNKYGAKSYNNNSVVNVSGKVIDHEEVCNIVESGLDMWFTAGRFNDLFEKKLKQIIDIKYLITCNSGSSANLIALSSLCNKYIMGNDYIPEGSEVITCAVGFPTTVNPIIANKLTPVFIDSELKTFNINANKIEKAITERTKAIMIAHTLGNPFDLEKIKNICDKYNLYLIEDCCDALGSKYDGQHVGKFGDIGTLSFYPAHHITMGEGGAIFTNSSKIKKSMESIRDWGRDCWCKTGCDNTCKKRFDWKFEKLPYGYDHKYVYSALGYNLKITDMQAAIGLAQLNKLKKFIDKRKSNFSYLYNLLKDLDKWLVLPGYSSKANPSWFGFPILIKDKRISRNYLVNYLEENQIKTRLIFAGNIIKQPYMEYHKYKKVGSLNNSDTIMKNGFWLGIYPGLSKTNLKKVSNHIHKFIESLNLQ